MNVEHEIYDYTSNYWSYLRNYKRLKEAIGNNSTQSLEKTAILETSRTITKVQQSET
jgi:hypothetical protein